MLFILPPFMLFMLSPLLALELLLCPKAGRGAMLNVPVFIDFAGGGAMLNAE